MLKAVDINRDGYNELVVSFPVTKHSSFLDNLLGKAVFYSSFPDEIMFEKGYHLSDIYRLPPGYGATGFIAEQLTWSLQELHVINQEKAGRFLVSLDSSGTVERLAAHSVTQQCPSSSYVKKNFLFFSCAVPTSSFLQ